MLLAPSSSELLRILRTDLVRRSCASAPFTCDNTTFGRLPQGSASADTLGATSHDLVIRAPARHVAVASTGRTIRTGTGDRLSGPITFTGRWPKGAMIDAMTDSSASRDPYDIVGAFVVLAKFLGEKDLTQSVAECAFDSWADQ